MVSSRGLNKPSHFPHQVDGYTPLLAAAEAGHAGIVSMLIEAGCNVNNGKMVRMVNLHSELDLLQWPMILLLSTFRTQGDGAASLFVAAQMGHTSVLRALLKSDHIDIDQTRVVREEKSLLASCTI
jgi:ankyrin repeat protein